MRDIAANPDNMLPVKQTADRLFTSDSAGSLPAARMNQVPFVVRTADERAGLEDRLSGGA